MILSELQNGQCCGGPNIVGVACGIHVFLLKSRSYSWRRQTIWSASPTRQHPQRDGRRGRDKREKQREPLLSSGLSASSSLLPLSPALLGRVQSRQRLGCGRDRLLHQPGHRRCRPPSSAVGVAVGDYVAFGAGTAAEWTAQVPVESDPSNEHDRNGQGAQQ